MEEAEKQRLLRNVARHYKKPQYFGTFKYDPKSKKLTEATKTLERVKPKIRIGSFTAKGTSFAQASRAAQVARATSQARMASTRLAGRMVVGTVPRSMSSLYTLGRVATLASRATLITAVIGVIFQVAVEVSARGQVQKMIRMQKETYKKLCKIGLQQLDSHIQGTLQNAANNIDLGIRVDTSNYDKALKEYIKATRRDASEIVNQKAYWIGIGAIKETYKANRTAIKNDLEKPADKMHGLTVAEAIIVTRRHKNHEKPLTRGELRKEARQLINKRIRAIGFLKSGWIPGVKRLAPLVSKRISVGMQKPNRAKDKGGASPASRTTFTNRYVASIWNDIIADNNPRAQAYMRMGLQKSLDAEARSMMSYVEAKMRKNAEKFNRA